MRKKSVWVFLTLLFSFTITGIDLPPVPQFKRPAPPQLPSPQVKPAPSVPPVTTPSATNSSAPTAGAAVCLTAEEKRLVDLINQYRRTKGLPTLAATKSMTRVAQVHAKDLTDNRPASGMCNMHSWSAKGSWSACCYTSDHRQAKCMWKKPSELTQYRGSGFEISAGSSGAAIDAATALRVWQGSSGHNSVIVNIGMWNKPWQAFGVGMNAGYAVAWFGHEADAAGVAEVCK